MSANIVAILNSLIETAKDGEKGFLKAAEDTTDQYLQSLFRVRAEDCGRAVVDLQECVTQLGAVPENSGSVLGALHRGWIDVKTAVVKRDNHAILAECERGEDAAKANYLNALNENLPVNIRILLEKQYQSIIKNHNLIRDLRDQYA